MHLEKESVSQSTATRCGDNISKQTNTKQWRVQMLLFAQIAEFLHHQKDRLETLVSKSPKQMKHQIGFIEKP